MDFAWSLVLVRPLKAIHDPSLLVTQWGDLELREAALKIDFGQPILLPPSRRPDEAVIGYLNSGAFKRLSKQTQFSYAKDLKVIFSYLEKQHKNWRDTTTEDIFNYEFWRRRDSNNPRRISGTKFSRELAAMQHFFTWQVKHDAISRNPIEVKEVISRNGNNTTVIGIAPRNARRINVKWLTPRAYKEWRDVGLGGYDAGNLRDKRWRGRTDGRNVTFADLLWSSGLRLTEGATLLTFEIPSKRTGDRFVRGRLGESVAKGGSKRDFWTTNLVLDRINSYIQIDRKYAIDRALREGRYNELTGLVVAERISSSRVLHYRTENGEQGQLGIDQVDADLRRKIFVRHGDVLVPAYLWLTESGLPMSVETWEAVFKQANLRCSKLGLALYCHPHMLRHSFALKMLVTLMHVFERRMSLSPEERREYRMIFGDPWTLVQTLLGHKSPEVTRDTYLEPVKGLQLDLFLNDSLGEDSSVEELLTRIAMDSDLIADIPKLKSI